MIVPPLVQLLTLVRDHRIVRLLRSTKWARPSLPAQGAPYFSFVVAFSADMPGHVV